MGSWGCCRAVAGLLQGCCRAVAGVLMGGVLLGRCWEVCCWEGYC